MRPQLLNSPLTEVACEVRFPGDLALLASWGTFQAAVRSEFPKLYVPGAEPGVAPLVQHVKLTSADESESLLLAVNSFAFSTRRYAQFGKFRSRVGELHAKFAGCTEIRETTRFGLRYTNRLPPALLSGNDDDQPGVLHPALKLRLDGVDLVRGSIRGQCQLIFEREFEEKDLKLRFSLVPAAFRIAGPSDSFPYSPGVQLDFDCYREGHGKFVDFDGFLDDAHQVIDDAFFGVITDEFQSYLKGEELPS